MSEEVKFINSTFILIRYIYLIFCGVVKQYLLDSIIPVINRVMKDKLRIQCQSQPCDHSSDVNIF